MTTQETIYTMLAVEGDVLFLDKGKYCGVDLTTEPGAFWLLVRLPEWDRFEEFCNGLWHTGDSFFHIEEVGASAYIIKTCLTWLTTDAKNGKAPALFNALCEFEGLEVEG